MRAAHQLIPFIKGLAQKCHPFRTILSQEMKYKWTDEHENASKNLRSVIETILKNAHFDNQAEARVTCYASREGLGADLELFSVDERKPVTFASRVLNLCEQRYSTNQIIQRQTGVWSTSGTIFTVESFSIRTDHRALLSVLRDKRENKTQYSRLTRWIVRLLPFSFNIEHIP